MNSKSELISKIIGIEWDMFSSVNEGLAKASCQEDRVTFEGMRRAQYEAWSEDTVCLFLSDILTAALAGRNLVSEKYIHMMRSTSPALYEKLIEEVPPVPRSAEKLAREISDKMLEQTELLFKKYPQVSGAGRPLRSSQDGFGETSVEAYQLGELYTYSEKTLRALRAHLLELENSGEALAGLILANTVKFYGYASLDAAEASARKRLDETGFQISVGCDACEE